MQSSEQLVKLFKAFTHPTRLEILDILRQGEECVCHMEAQLGYRQAYISQHLMVLRDAGLVEVRRDGWNVFYRVIEPGVFDLLDQAQRMMGMAVAAPKPRHRSSTCPCPKCSITQAAKTAVTV